MTASLPPHKIAVLSAALLLVGCAEPAPQGQLWGAFHTPISLMTAAPSSTTQISFYRVENSKVRDYWTAHRTQFVFKKGRRSVEDFWTDSVTCPALLTVIADTRALRDVDFKEENMGLDTAPAILKVEGGSPDLTADPPFQKVEWKFEGPLLKWNENLDKQLQGCWSKQPPRTPGQ